jgi:hypothetical protein
MILAEEISDEFVEIIEQDVGFSSKAWDCVDPKQIIAAVLNITKEAIDA